MKVLIIVFHVPQRCSKPIVLPHQSHVRSYTGSERHISLKHSVNKIGTNPQSLPQTQTSHVMLVHMITGAAPSLYQPPFRDQTKYVIVLKLLNYTLNKLGGSRSHSLLI